MVIRLLYLQNSLMSFSDRLSGVWERKGKKPSNVLIVNKNGKKYILIKMIAMK